MLLFKDSISSEHATKEATFAKLNDIYFKRIRYKQPQQRIKAN